MSLFSRREFVRVAAVTGAGVASGAIRPAAAAATPDRAEKFKLRYVLSTNQYGCLPVADIVPEAARAGCEGLDVWAGRWGNQREQIDEMGDEKFAGLLHEHRTKVMVYSVFNPGFGKSEPQMRAVKAFGGDMLVAGLPGSVPGAKDLRGADLKRAIQVQVDKLRPAFDKAGEFGVKIAIENHLNGLLEPPEGMSVLMDVIRDSHVGIAFAPFHLPQNPVLLGKLVGDLGERLLYYYAWQRGDGSGEIPLEVQKNQLPGVGPLDFTPMLAALKRIRFQGWTSIFMHPTPRGAPLHPTIGAVTAQLNRSRAYLERILATV